MWHHYFVIGLKPPVDIGASDGIYTFHILETSRDCLAFEPRQSSALKIAEMAKCLSLPVRVETIALSDVVGEATLRVFETWAGRATVERENRLEDCDHSKICEVTVPTRRLDDYDLDAVGFIKIDVEGHELSVLKGASHTIERHRPLMLIEVEDRHKSNATRNLRRFLDNLGYEGYFLLDGRLVSMMHFDLAIHQQNWRKSGLYINNFFFVMSAELCRLEAAVRSVRENLSDTFPRA